MALVKVELSPSSSSVSDVDGVSSPINYLTSTPSVRSRPKRNLLKEFGKPSPQTKKKEKLSSIPLRETRTRSASSAGTLASALSASPSPSKLSHDAESFEALTSFSIPVIPPTPSQQQQTPKKLYYKCGECGALVKGTKKTIREHENFHKPGGKGNKCELCGWLVIKLRPHMKRWHSEKSSSLNIKVRPFEEILGPKTDPKIPQQVDNSHPDYVIERLRLRSQLIYKCRKCQAAVKNPKKMNDHLKIHEEGGPKASICEECGWLVASSRMHVHKSGHRFHERNRNKNIYRVNPSAAPAAAVGGRLYLRKCSDCGATCKSKSLLKAHKELHSNGLGKTCKHCGWLVQGMSFHSMKYHPKSETEGNQSVRKREIIIPEDIPFYCDACPMIFIDVYNFIAHFNLAHKKVVGMIQCEFCKEKLGSKQLLQLHLKSSHPEQVAEDEEVKEEGEEEEVDLQCEHCSESFGSKLKHDFHMAKVHPESIISCSKCGLKFSSYFLYKKHNLTFHNEDPGPSSKLLSADFPCDICGVVFPTKFFLNRHRLKVHSEELGTPRFDCGECGKVFYAKQSLQNHLAGGHKLKPRMKWTSQRRLKMELTRKYKKTVNNSPGPSTRSSTIANDVSINNED